MDVKYVLFNTVKEIQVTLKEIKFQTKFINQTKKELMNQKVKTNNIFATCNGILMYEKRVVIPAVLTKKILKDFHIGQLGMSRMKAPVSSYIYWPGIDKDIEKHVEIMQKLCIGSKSTSLKIQSMALRQTNRRLV